MWPYLILGIQGGKPLVVQIWAKLGSGWFTILDSIGVTNQHEICFRLIYNLTVFGNHQFWGFWGACPYMGMPIYGQNSNLVDFWPWVLLRLLISIKFAIDWYMIWPFLRKFNFCHKWGWAELGHAQIWAKLDPGWFPTLGSIAIFNQHQICFRLIYHMTIFE